MNPQPSLPTSRRRFLAGSAATALVATVPGRALAVEDPSLFPFQWGVASGDPLGDRVIVWTRVDPSLGAAVPVTWVLATDPDLSAVAASGTAEALAARDHTVKVDATGLEPGTTYYFAFTAADRRSMIGRTRTAPAGPTDRIRLGLASCAKYEDGLYNAYRLLADEDVDAVLHLGDYEYVSSGGGIDGRAHDPDHLAVTRDDYRSRYRQYRLDPDLQRAHQQHPFIDVWDDNDMAGNAWRDGAQGHQDDEHGPWPERKRIAQEVFAEYHPIRLPVDGDVDRIWRSLPFGDLAEIVMMDTRLERDEQVSNAAAGSTAENDDPDRVMLSAAQRAFVYERLATSPAQWKILGQQVVMCHWRLIPLAEEAAPVVQALGLTAKSGVFYNSDGWDGYTAERDALFAHIADRGIDDVVVATGDVHSSWANELVPGANVVNQPVGVEFVTPAISTTPFASLVGGSPNSAVFEAQFTAANPWIRYVDMDANGYTVLDLDAERVQAAWTHVTTDARPGEVTEGPVWESATGTSRLTPATTRTGARADRPPPAPDAEVIGPPDRNDAAATGGAPASASTGRLPATGGGRLLAAGVVAAAVAVGLRAARSAVVRRP